MNQTTLPRASRRHALLAGALLALSAAGLAGCSDSGSDTQAGSAGAKGAASTLEAAKAAGKIRIGYANEAPFAYMDSQRAEVTGESVEIARVVLKRMGINQVEGVLTEFGSLIPGLQARRFDIIAAGMYVTPERCGQAAFSNPTYGVSQAMLVKQGNPKNLHSYEDAAKNPEARLGVVVGAIESDYAASLKVPPDRTVVFPDAVSALAGVQAGRADAYAATALTVNDLMGKAGRTAAWKRPSPSPIR